MFKTKGFIDKDDDINIYVNGGSYHYDSYFQYGVNKIGFLIPIVDIGYFKNYYKTRNILVFRNSNKDWIKIDVIQESIHDNIWRNNKHFEYVVQGASVVLDKSELRDFKLKFIFENF